MKYRDYAYIGSLVIGVAVMGICLYNQNFVTIKGDVVDGKTFELNSKLDEKLKISTGAESVVYGNNGLVIGKNRVVLYKNDKSQVVSINVVDTERPKFIKSASNIKIKKGSSEEDILNYFKAEDLSNVLEYYVIGDIDYNTVGIYNIDVACSDASSNTATVNTDVEIME